MRRIAVVGLLLLARLVVASETPVLGLQWGPTERENRNLALIDFCLGNLSPACDGILTAVRATPPTTEQISNNGTITADACGTIKRITSSGAVSTNGTDTFTSPGPTNVGCVMDVCNVGSNAITLTTNANFVTTANINVTLSTADECVRVGSDGTTWRQLATAGATNTVVGTTDGTAIVGRLITTIPATETVTAGETLDPDACGTVMRLQSTGAVTTSTSQTIGTPPLGAVTCWSILCNIDGVDTITLDANASFVTFGGDNVPLAPGDCVWVATTDSGTTWRQLAPTTGTTGEIGSSSDVMVGRLVTTPASSEPIGAGGTVTADSCGSVKRIVSTGSVTTGATTIGAVSGTVTGQSCVMVICNADPSDTITLASNASFVTIGNADIELAPDDCVSAGTTNNGTSWIQLTPDTNETGVVPATQTIAAGGTITANACKGIKRIGAAGPVTTDTTDTFSAPSSANAGCVMDVCNTASVVTLDANSNFTVYNGSNIPLTNGECIRVASDGTKWYAIAYPTNGVLEQLTSVFILPPTAETIVDTVTTITVDACGGVKRIASAGAVATNALAFEDPGAISKTGCVMHVCNSGANNITLKDSATVLLGGTDGTTGGDTLLTANDCVTVVSDGTNWRQVGRVSLN